VYVNELNYFYGRRPPNHPEGVLLNNIFIEAHFRGFGGEFPKGVNELLNTLKS
jgi:hypothetical protein